MSVFMINVIKTHNVTRVARASSQPLKLLTLCVEELGGISPFDHLHRLTSK